MSESQMQQNVREYQHDALWAGFDVDANVWEQVWAAETEEAAEAGEGSEAEDEGQNHEHARPPIARRRAFAAGR